MLHTFAEHRTEIDSIADPIVLGRASQFITDVVLDARRRIWDAAKIRLNDRGVWVCGDAEDGPRANLETVAPCVRHDAIVIERAKSALDAIRHIQHALSAMQMLAREE